MAFVLSITDNTDTVDFLGSDFKVENGGFDISLPRAKRELAPIRDGFYIPIINVQEYREATIKFSIYGATRQAIITNLGKINRIMNSIHRQAATPAGKRGQLRYQWDGSTHSTYFEIYGMDFSFPQDVLSVEKIHGQEGGLYVIPECELKIFLSARGYGLSLYSAVSQQIHLSNAYQSRTTNPVTISNPGANRCNYVEILGSDISSYGDTPLITRLKIASGSTYSTWSGLYMGLVTQENYPTKIIYDSAEASASFGSTVVNANAEGGSYTEATWGGTGGAFREFFASFRWAVSNASVGIFHSFMHGYNQGFQTTYSAAIGIDDYVSYGIRYIGSYSTPGVNTYKTLPLGVLRIPPFDFEIPKLGSLQPDLEIGIFSAGSSTPLTIQLDFLSLLPILEGFRSLHTRVGTQASLTGTFFDDGWKGITYLERSGPAYATPIYASQDFLALVPGKTQRIYFQSVGAQTQSMEQGREFAVQLYVVPTFGAMAL